MTTTELSSSEAMLAELVHDLRQPLGNIETSAYCLTLLVDPAQQRAHEHLRAIERQVEKAAAMLTAVVARIQAT